MPVLKEEYFSNGKVILLTLNRPQSLNSINTDLAIALNEKLELIDTDPSVRAVVFTGSGTKAFCVGADLKERNHFTMDEWLKQHALFQQVFKKIRQLKVPIITAVNGYALGGGCELALSGDLIYAAASSEFGLPEVKIGFIPGVGGTQTIGRFLPRVHALKMLLTGERITAQEAYQFGMLNQVIKSNESGELVELALETADKISSNSPFAIKMGKKSFTLGIDMPLEEGIDFSLECYNQTLEHPDREEGVKAFNEKRSPNFKDFY
jgi:enoyl-CoA hydratase/carnithine racemase